MPIALLLVFDFLVFRIHYVAVVLFRVAALGIRIRIAAARGLLRGLLFRIHLLGQLVRRGGQRLRFGVDGFLVVAFQRFFGFLQSCLDLGLFIGRNLVAVFRQRFLHRVHERVGLVARGDELERLLVFLGVRFGVLHHALDLVLLQSRVRLNFDLVFLARRLVLGGHMQDAVG